MSQAALGILIIGGFLVVCLGEAIVIMFMAHKLGVCKGKLERYEAAEKQRTGNEG